MQNEFPDQYNHLFQNGFKRLRKIWVLKLQAMQACNDQMMKRKEEKALKEAAKTSNESFSITESSCEDHEIKYKDLINSNEDQHYQVECRQMDKLDYDTTSDDENEEVSESSEESFLAHDQNSMKF